MDKKIARPVKNIFFTTDKMMRRRHMPPLAKGRFRISGNHIGHGSFTSAPVWRMRANPKTNEIKIYAGQYVWLWKVPWEMLPEIAE